MWKDIWSEKGEDFADFDITNLIKADGFDTSGTSLNTRSWMDFFEYVAKLIQIDSDKKWVLEIGCGGGAALKALSFINDKLEIYGIDYSQNLIKLAKRAIKNGNFVCDEAINIDSIFAKENGGGGDLTLYFQTPYFITYQTKNMFLVS